MTAVERFSVVVPANWVPGPQQGQWNYEEYAKLLHDEHRYEVVDGVLYMAPSPSWEHQGIVVAITSHVNAFVRSTNIGYVRVAPFDVELSYRYIVQPDVLVVLNEHLDRVVGSRLIGAPDLVVEVASPSTARHDLHQKSDAYAYAGVPEYWIVTPGSKTVEVLLLENGQYTSSGISYGKVMVPSRVLAGLPVEVEQFFGE